MNFMKINKRKRTTLALLLFFSGALASRAQGQSNQPGSPPQLSSEQQSCLQQKMGTPQASQQPDMQKMQQAMSECGVERPQNGGSPPKNSQHIEVNKADENEDESTTQEQGTEASTCKNCQNEDSLKKLKKKVADLQKTIDEQNRYIDAMKPVDMTDVLELLQNRGNQQQQHNYSQQGQQGFTGQQQMMQPQMNQQQYGNQQSLLFASSPFYQSQSSYPQSSLYQMQSMYPSSLYTTQSMYPQSMYYQSQMYPSLGYGTGSYSSSLYGGTISGGNSVLSTNNYLNSMANPSVYSGVYGLNGTTR